jgi:hypothetical protein
MYRSKHVSIEVSGVGADRRGGSSMPTRFVGPATRTKKAGRPGVFRLRVLENESPIPVA